jgi:DNA segregation ATPase FtsK/SpoIIIE, S-DNA-T family
MTPTPLPSPSDVVLRLHGHGLDLNHLVQLAPAAGAYLGDHYLYGVVGLVTGCGIYGVVKVTRHMPKSGGKRWRNPVYTLRKNWGWKRHTAKAKMRHTPLMIGVHPTPAGEAMTVQLIDSTTPADLIASADRYASALKVRRVVVEPVPEDASKATVHIVRKDVFEKPRLWPLCDAEKTNWRTPIPVGVDLYGHEFKLSLGGGTTNHLLIAGETGAGKSNALQLILAHAGLDPRARMFLFDGKYGAELRAWEERAEIFERNPDNPRQSNQSMRLIAKMVRARYEALYKANLRAAPPSMEPMVLVIDEYASWTVDQAVKADGTEFEKLVMGMARIARAAGCTIVIATQRPTHDVISTSLRSQLTWRWCMRVMSSGDSDVILSPGWAKKGYDASTLSQENPGEGYIRHKARNPVLCRAYELPDSHLAAIAARAVSIRPSGHDKEADKVLPADQLSRAKEQVTASKAEVHNENRPTGTDGTLNGGEEGLFWGEVEAGLENRDRTVLAEMTEHPMTDLDMLAFAFKPGSRSLVVKMRGRLAAHDLIEALPRQQREPVQYKASFRGRRYLAWRDKQDVA